MNFNITRRIDCSTRGYNLLSPRYEPNHIPNPCYDIEAIQLLRLYFFYSLDIRRVVCFIFFVHAVEEI